MALAVPAKPSVRDRRLDVLRGLCLLDMVLVHLLEQHVHVPFVVNEAIMHWLRFAAGGFVMTSGLCIGAIHFQRALDPAKRIPTYVSLLQRALFVLGVHYFASILTLILIPVHGQPVYDVGRMIWEVLTLHSGYDLLLFYVFMLAVSPLIIEALRRFGVIAAVVASVGIFFWRYDNPYLSLWAIENHFPLIRWQLIFVIGLALGSKLKAFDTLPAKAKWHLLAAAISTALGIDILSAAERAGYFTLPWYLAVTKMPLSLLEVVRYLSLAVAAGVMLDRAWKWFSDSTAQRALAAVGVQSLMLWVVHVPVVANVAPLPWPIAMLAAWALVWVAAVSGTWLTKQWNTRCTTLPRFTYVVPVIGSLLVSFTLWRLEIPRTTDLPLASAESTDESIFFSGDGSDLPIPVDDDSISDAA